MFSLLLGGPEILLEYKHADASLQFDIANHSWVAVKLARDFLVWSAVEAIGRPGLPAFALRPTKLST